MAETVAALRSFNRSFTQRIGVLDDSFLGSGRPLGQARLLFEIGPGEATTTLELRRRLGLDSGYLSRLLRDLEAEGSVTVTTDPDDNRRRVVQLTEHGREEWGELDRRSDALAAVLVGPLTPRQQVELSSALHTADRLLRAATVAFDVVDPRSPPAIACMSAYFGELDERFTSGFDPGDALDAAASGMTAPHGVFVVARSDARSVACGGVVRLDRSTAEIKRMWVDREWRGLGIGRRMLTALEQHAAALGHDRVVLDTNATLSEAIGMYTRAGYTEIDRYNDNPYAEHWFEKRLRSSCV